MTTFAELNPAERHLFDCYRLHAGKCERLALMLDRELRIISTEKSDVPE